MAMHLSRYRVRGTARKTYGGKLRQYVETERKRGVRFVKRNGKVYGECEYGTLGIFNTGVHNGRRWFGFR